MRKIVVKWLKFVAIDEYSYVINDNRRKKKYLQQILRNHRFNAATLFGVPTIFKCDLKIF